MRVQGKSQEKVLFLRWMVTSSSEETASGSGRCREGKWSAAQGVINGQGLKRKHHPPQTPCPLHTPNRGALERLGWGSVE